MTRPVRPLPLASAQHRRPDMRSPFEVIVRRYDGGDTVLEQGAPIPGLFLIHDGTLREACVSAEGRWLVLGIRGAGDVLGSVTTCRPSPTSLRAITATSVALVTTRAFDDWMQRRPEVAWRLLQRLDQRDRNLVEALQRLAWDDVATRIRMILRDLGRTHGRAVPGGTRIEIGLTQEEIAALVGSTRETVNRAVVSMMAAGVLRLDHRRYVVADRSDLDASNP